MNSGRYFRLPGGSRVLHCCLTLGFATVASSLSWNKPIMNMFSSKAPAVNVQPILIQKDVPNWDDLKINVMSTIAGDKLSSEENLRSMGDGLPHTDSKLRRFGTTDAPRVLYYRDTAAW